jgi:hypothetical protein
VLRQLDRRFLTLSKWSILPIKLFIKKGGITVISEGVADKPVYAKSKKYKLAIELKGD